MFYVELAQFDLEIVYLVINLCLLLAFLPDVPFCFFLFFEQFINLLEFELFARGSDFPAAVF